MTTDQIIQRLAECTKRNKYLRNEHQRLWEKSEHWKAKSEERRVENNRLRMTLLWTRESRDAWKQKAMASRPPRLSIRTDRPNLLLSPEDVKRILEIPVRD